MIPIMLNKIKEDRIGPFRGFFEFRLTLTGVKGFVHALLRLPIIGVIECLVT